MAVDNPDDRRQYEPGELDRLARNSGKLGLDRPKEYPVINSKDEVVDHLDASDILPGIEACKLDHEKVFTDHLSKMKEVHDKKSHDYANKDNRYSNFEYAAAVAAPFSDPVDTVFAVMLGIKLARIAELRSAGKIPNNESIEDSFLDKDNYSVLWSTYRKTHP